MIMLVHTPTNPRLTKKPTAQTKRRSFPHVMPFRKVYQFKIVLQGIEPTIWRRIQVPDYYTFWDLHCAITDAFGWLDYHMHQFTICNPKGGKTELIGMPDKEGFEDDVKTLPGWKKKIARYFTLKNNTCDYLYDFGDGWEHTVVLESILPKEEKVIYPSCIAGENACPPEDVGSTLGYQHFLKVMADPQHEEHDDLLAWVGGWFDPAWFDLSLIRFEDPAMRWNIAFLGWRVPKNIRKVQYHQLRKENP